jgi:hypothetical protein
VRHPDDPDDPAVVMGSWFATRQPEPAIFTD